MSVSGYRVKQLDGILLNANESYQNIDADIVEEITKEIAKVSFHRYPDDSCTALKEAYAQYCGVSAKQMIVGNGSDEMLGLLIGLQIKEGKKLYTLSYDFSMYDYYVSMHNGEVVKYDWELAKNFDVDDFIQVGLKEKVDMIVFSNPNNPTGRVICQKDLCKIVEAFPQAYVVIDEAYGDFDDTTMLDYIEKYDRLIVTRTLSKAFALAGIRCGFLLACQKTIDAIAPYKVPYNVNTLTQVSATIVLRHSERMKNTITEIKRERDHLFQKVQALHKSGITLYPSKTNYLFGRCDNKEKLQKLFEDKGIVIRYYQDDTFRITIGSKMENEMLYEVFCAY